MGRIIVGGALLGVGLLLTFVPPFVFGPIMMVGGFYMLARGTFGVTKDAAKATAAGVQAVQGHLREQDLARRERDLAEREQAFSRQNSSAPGP